LAEGGLTRHVRYAQALEYLQRSISGPVEYGRRYDGVPALEPIRPIRTGSGGHLSLSRRIIFSGGGGALLYFSLLALAAFLFRSFFPSGSLPSALRYLTSFHPARVLSQNIPARKQSARLAPSSIAMPVACLYWN